MTEELVSSVSPKGQVTIPAEIRRALGVKPRDRVSFRLENGTVQLAPVQSPIDASFMAVPPLKRVRSWKDMEREVAEEQAHLAAREGLE